MDSRLLATLNSQASNTRDPVVWAKAVCRAASHFARHGRTDDAVVSIGLVRDQFKSELHRDVASWLMLAEGVLYYFQAKTSESFDRIRRAYGLAVALQTRSALPSCAAWMAHVEFFDSKYEEMAKHLGEALTQAATDDHQALARASLVLATSYHLADQYQLARPWYEKARLHAAEEGDDATVSAMLHDVAAYRAANVRLIDTFGGDIQSEIRRARLELSSSVNFDNAIGHHGLDFLTLMLRGLLQTIGRDFYEALATFESIDESQVPEKLRIAIQVDRAWCLVNLGKKNEAWDIANLALNNIVKVAEDDELAYTYSRLSQVAYCCQYNSRAEELRSLALGNLSKHRNFQVSLLERLKAIPTENKNPA
jgi:hypothetical protein